MKAIRLTITMLGFFCFLATGCEKESDHPDFPASEFISEGTYSGDYWPTEAWRTCTPGAVGMDADLLQRINDEVLILKRLHVDIHSILIVKDGYIVAEQYYASYSPDSLHPVYSCTKSITSVLCGIALEKGLISSPDERVLDHFPEYEFENMSPQKESITLEHMLTMSAGFDWMEMEYPYNDENNSFYQWIRSADRIKYVLDLPLVSSPGSEFNYNTGISHVLSAVLQKTSGNSIDELAKEWLFVPMGVQEYSWFIDANGIATGGHGLHMRTRDMARFGLLCLNGGEWEDEQLVPQDWLGLSTAAHIPRKYLTDYQYGYHWWVKPDAYYAAVGVDGQWIFVVPQHRLVVVMTNGLNNTDYLQYSTPERLLNTYVIPSIKQ